METNGLQKISQSITLKAILIGVISLVLLIPGAMIESLIRERQQRCEQTITKINEKWSNAQTINGPYLIIPYQTKITDDKRNVSIEKHSVVFTPDYLDMKVKLIPEERHYGIYKSILYKSKLEISGNFRKPVIQLPPNSEIIWDKAMVRFGISDLRGLTSNPDFVLGGSHFQAVAGANTDAIGSGVIIALKDMDVSRMQNALPFNCELSLKGSTSINFIPSGKTTRVQMDGAWKAPGFIGNFTPDYKLGNKGFSAKWDVLHFNRNIPESWTDNEVTSVTESSFGVTLVDTVNHYQQNMRAAKYEFMFVALTFVVFFFVEILTRKRIHPIQYLLVGVALVLFYSLLLSISEQINFGTAYLIGSFATIGLIVTYAHGIFRNKMHTGILSAFLIMLYTFLYVVLQLEDVALLIGSIGLFLILGIIMYVSRKINWYKPADDTLNS